jgi:hypothetical protein
MRAVEEDMIVAILNNRDRKLGTTKVVQKLNISNVYHE